MDMIRISEADYKAAMSDHHKYIREAERLGPVWFDLRQRKAIANAGRPQGIRALVAQARSIGSALSASLRIRRVAQRQSAS
jgi:hypothetical protein